MWKQGCMPSVPVEYSHSKYDSDPNAGHELDSLPDDHTKSDRDSQFGMHSTVSRFRAFIDASTQQGGNACTLISGYSSDPAQQKGVFTDISQYLQTLQIPPLFDGALCLLSSVDIDDQTPSNPSDSLSFQVSCFTPSGDMIQCCGHGLLSTAFHIFQSMSSGSPKLASESSTIQLVMGDSTVNATLDGECVWLQFLVIETQPAIHAWLPLFFTGFDIQAVAQTSAADGYLIVQLLDDSDLAKVQLPGSALANFSQRALIVTTAVSGSGPHNMHFRYFAPQYGVAEDTATGSAMRILAAFWHPRFQFLNALQCSTQQGVLKSVFCHDHVKVGGFCVRDNTTTI